ncbi:MAG TPA: hypothetical protein DEH02_00900 [Bacteroidales bacterium]|nr:MAG: hypothetical protein A2X01_02115 [Bacteroidetes bacterium GWF2_35_48]OFY98727.1 MAG: hypothetical protein A2491_01885 [Bacteroidetes bacterium RIFOXYC12_FULL_35_7]HBX49607.1 hypothetical protein [Bacteroidales bacterium]
MKNTKHSLHGQTYPEETNRQKIIKIILKLVIGFGIISVLFFIAITITHKKLSQLSETVTEILEPDMKIIKLKEITSSLYGADANVKAYAINQDTSFLRKYKSYINKLNTSLDTLLWLYFENKIIDENQEKSNQVFSLQIDTLRELINWRIRLFTEYIKLKTGNDSQDVLVKLLKKIQIKKTIVKKDIEKEIEVPEKSFLSRLFSSKKSKKNKSDIVINKAIEDSTHVNIQKMITQVQQDEKIKENKILLKEISITRQEYFVTNLIFSLVNQMEEKELALRIVNIHKATNETSSKINFISNSITIFGLLLAFLFWYFIYLDILRAKRFKEQLLITKTNVEKNAAHYSLSLIEASLNPLITINSDGKIMDVNEATVLITGLSRDKLKGTDFFDYFTEPLKARLVYKDVFALGSVIDSPLVLRHVDGKLTDVLFNGSVYKNGDGVVQGVVVVARDITKQKLFENELIDAKSNAEQATKKAEASTKLKDAFLANMSHEIRTPMNAIMGFSDILYEREMGVENKEYLRIIKSAGENLLTIINDILDISKIEAGMMTFEATNFSIKETFKSLFVLMMEKTKEKHIELSLNCDEDVPDVLLGDHTRLTQIIINLTSNAIKFTKNGENRKGSVSVRAKVLKKENENTFIEFTVTDNGIGIPADKLESIFERFQQAESHTTRLYGGTGLGLSIAKQLVDLQGGCMTVKSELKVGSEFTFSIPYQKSVMTQIESDEVEKKYDMNELSKLNILMAEDNQLNVKLILCLFSENNLKVKVAENGIVAIEMLKENDFDIVLMDMEMPVMNGYETATFIRKELKCEIPIIAMTAHAMAGERDKCLSLGMNDYISKPINSILLFEKIYDLTHRS